MLNVGVLGAGAIAAPYYMTMSWDMAPVHGRVAIATSCARPTPIGADIAHAFPIKPFGEDLLDARTLF